MGKNIINFLLETEKLKETVRTGWKEVGIPKEKVESVADHICGCMILVFTLASEKRYSNLDLIKVLKMIVAKELTKVITLEQSVISQDKKAANKRDLLSSMTEGLRIKEELLSAYDEFSLLESDEAKFALHVGKLESDIQAKKYELQGDFTLENALNDINNFPSGIKEEILPQVENPSDGWLLFDRRYYGEDETFNGLSKEVQKMKKQEN